MGLKNVVVLGKWELDGNPPRPQQGRAGEDPEAKTHQGHVFRRPGKSTR